MQYMKTLKFLFRNKVTGSNTDYEVIDMRGFDYVPKYSYYLAQSTKKVYLIIDSTKITDYVCLELASLLNTFEHGYSCIVTDNLCSNMSLIAMFSDEIILTKDSFRLSLPDPYLFKYFQNKMNKHNRKVQTLEIIELDYSREITQLEKRLFGFTAPRKIRRKRRTFRNTKLALNERIEDKPESTQIDVNDFVSIEDENPKLKNDDEPFTEPTIPSQTEQEDVTDVSDEEPSDEESETGSFIIQNYSN